MKEIKKLILDNKAWVQEKTEVNPDYFRAMALDQQPTFLWIGCSDSRVPPNEITGCNPGEMFVARNVANLVTHTDLSLISIVEYAVFTLKVKHIIICGHYGCGGVKASMGHQSLGMINKWLINIKDVYFKHSMEMQKITDPSQKLDRLVELNVLEQAKNLTHSSLIQRAWNNGQDLYIHGWVYEMATGFLKELVTIDKNYPIDEIYRYDF